MEIVPLGLAHFPSCLRYRDPASHKGSHGSVAVVGGAAGMGGALLLASRSALLQGAGRVFGVFLDGFDKLAVGRTASSAVLVDIQYPELMLRSAADLLNQPFMQQITAVAIGPGLGTSDAALNILAQLLQANFPLVIDADALNLLALHPDLQKFLLVRVAPTVLTPHPAEAARLLSCSTDDVQNHRENACLNLVRQTGAYVVLKGQGSLICSPANCLAGSGLLYQNLTGNPGMASAGMGDILTGMVTAFLAQGAPPMEALSAAVYIHGLAADDLVAQGIGPIGLTASEVACAARNALNRLVNSYQAHSI